MRDSSYRMAPEPARIGARTQPALLSACRISVGDMGSIFRRRDSDAFEQWRNGTTEAAPEPAPAEPQVSVEPITDEPAHDWTTAPLGEVPPWRREDRALVDGARAA